LGEVRSVAFSPDGTKIASGVSDDPGPGPKIRIWCIDDCHVRIWDAATAQCTATLRGHSDKVYSVAFSPDGAKIASGSIDGTVRIWDASTAQCTATLQEHSDSVYSVAFSPDGTKIATGSEDKTVRIWDAAIARCTATLQWLWDLGRGPGEPRGPGD
jgi:WD40 repeat protein